MEEKRALILGPYKEPLRKIENGHGYFGALSFDVEGRLQCHVCGEVFDNLSAHLRTHKISVKEYRSKFGIAPRRKLISEKERELCKERRLRQMAAWTPEQKQKFRDDSKKHLSKATEARAKTKYEISPEHLNLRGICPDQLLELINRAVKHYGYVPSSREFNALFTNRYHEPIYRTFGSWSNAVKKAGHKLKKQAYNKRGGKKYDDEELLDYLSVFYQEHNKIPTKSDCYRGFLPSEGAYRKHFGSFVRARELAGIPELI